MAPKDFKKRRLQDLKDFVTDPDKLCELLARDGDSLQSKLRQKAPGEKTWQQFLRRSTFDQIEQEQVDELSLLVLGHSTIGTASSSSSPEATVVAAPPVAEQVVAVVVSPRKRLRCKSFEPANLQGSGAVGAKFRGACPASERSR